MKLEQSSKSILVFLLDWGLVLLMYYIDLLGGIYSLLVNIRVKIIALLLMLIFVFAIVTGMVYYINRVWVKLGQRTLWTVQGVFVMSVFIFIYWIYSSVRFGF